MKIVVKSVDTDLIPSGLKISVTATAIQKKNFKTFMAILIISNREIKDTIKNSSISQKIWFKTIKNEAKEQNDGFSSI